MRLAKEGYPYIVVPLLLAVALLVLGYWFIAAPLLLVALFMLYFFRDPNREVPTDPDIIVSPADGKVMRVVPIASDNAESPTLVSIFLSPLDVHINRAPIAGRVRDISYKRGKYLMATRNEASSVNEQNILTIEGPRVTVVCKQIAGILARRIVCWKHPGDELEIGERFGLIKFSSRTDLILPSSVDIAVREGDRVRGGTTIIGRMSR